MSARPSLLLVPPAIVLALAGCTANVSSISPSSVAAAGPAFKMTVLGSGFTSGSTVQWNGSSRSTTYVSATELLAQINQADIASPASASITVNNAPVTSGSATTASNAKTIDIVAQSIDATAYQADPAHDGAVTFSSVTVPSGNGSAWSVNLGTGTPSNIVIAGGKVFLTTGTSSGSQLLALSQTNGSTAWGPSAISGLTGGAAGIAYDSGQVFVAEAGFGDGTLYAYNANTGALAWSTPLAASPGAPTAADGFVYVIAAGSSTLYALDETTGAIAWQQSLSLAGGSPAVTADGVYVTSSTSGCSTTDFRPATGEVIWTSSDGSTSLCPQTADETPAVFNQSVYSPDSTGSVIFAAETGGSSTGTLSYSLPGAFTTTAAFFPRGANLDAIGLSGNSTQWTFTGDNELDVPPIVVSDGTSQYVICGSSLGNVYVIDATSGTSLWTGTVSGKVEQLAAGDGLLLVVSETGSGGALTAYTLSTNP